MSKGMKKEIIYTIDSKTKKEWIRLISLRDKTLCTKINCDECPICIKKYLIEDRPFFSTCPYSIATDIIRAIKERKEEDIDNEEEADDDE